MNENDGNLKFVRLMNDDCLLERFGALRFENCMDCFRRKSCFHALKQKHVNLGLYDDFYFNALTATEGAKFSTIEQGNDLYITRMMILDQIKKFGTNQKCKICGALILIKRKPWNDEICESCEKGNDEWIRMQGG